MKRCKFCGKKLVWRKTNKDESLPNFQARMFCDLSCRTRYFNKIKGYRSWSQDKLISYFLKHQKKNGIMQSGWPYFFSKAVEKYFGSWSWFLHKLDVTPSVDCVPFMNRLAVKDCLKYLRDEMDVTPGKSFELSAISLCGYGSIKSRHQVRQILEGLAKEGKIRRLKTIKKALRPSEIISYPVYYLTQ